MTITIRKSPQVLLKRLYEVDLHARHLIDAKSYLTAPELTIDDAMKAAGSSPRWCLIEAMKALETKGGGRMIVGRSGHPTRFHWNDDIDWKAVRGEEERPEPIIVEAREAGERAADTLFPPIPKVDKGRAALTPEQKLLAAYAHLIRGVNQMDIAIVLGGVNQGRVNEAITEVREAVGWAD